MVAGRKLNVLAVLLSALTGALSWACTGTGGSVRTLVSDHLALIRDLETRVMSLHQHQSGASAVCKPSQPLSLNAQAAQTMANHAKVWPVITDLYVTALRCDLFRFGNVLVTMGGDIFPAKYLTDSATNIHGEWFHNYPNHRPGVGFVINWELQMIAQFLGKLNDPAFPDSDRRVRKSLERRPRTDWKLHQ